MLPCLTSAFGQEAKIASSRSTSACAFSWSLPFPHTRCSCLWAKCSASSALLRWVTVNSERAKAEQGGGLNGVPSSVFGVFIIYWSGLCESPLALIYVKMRKCQSSFLRQFLFLSSFFLSLWTIVPKSRTKAAPLLKEAWFSFFFFFFFILKSYKFFVWTVKAIVPTIRTRAMIAASLVKAARLTVRSLDWSAHIK